MNIKIRKIRGDAQIPIRASDGAVGYDLFASRVLDKNTKEVVQDLPVEIPAGGSILIGVGVQLAIPWQHRGEIDPRSGLASKHDVELSNSPGTVDPDFRGEAGVLLRNRGDKPFVVKKDMRIAQMIFSRVEIPILEEVEEELPPTRRGSLGFGGTGFFGVGLGTKEYDEQIRRIDCYYMRVVLAAAERSVCARGVRKIDGKYERDAEGNLVGQTRRFGCIIVKDDNITAQGFNDQYPGSPKCAEVGCLREELGIPSGTKIETCRAMHAEWWALTNLARSGGGSINGTTMYVNTEPCEVCAKIIAGTGIETVVMLEGIYPTNGIPILREAGINIRYVKL